MRYLFALSGVLVVAAGCGGDFNTGKDLFGATGTGSAGNGSGGASTAGSSSAGGAASGTGGVQGGNACRSDGECPVSAAPCRMCADGTAACPWSKCVNGQCTGGLGSCPGGGSGGAAAGGAGGGNACTQDSQCPKSLAPCELCPDGKTACPWSKCENGQCVAGIDTCSSGSGGVSGAGGSTGTGGSPANGGASSGCSSNGDCVVPAICKACPNGGMTCATGLCDNGQCTTSFPPCPAGTGGTAGTGGMPGTGGSSGDLKWYPTCGPPLCRVPSPGSGGTSSGLPPCATTEVSGAPCSTQGAECDSGAACSGPLMCTTNDPTHGGLCPVSRAKYKSDIEYLSADERAKLADDVQSIPLVRYRYKDAPEREHLGFIIEDVEPSPGVDSPNDRVDLYGYTSMAVAALQQQRREIDALKHEVKELRAELGARSSTKASRHAKK